MIDVIDTEGVLGRLLRGIECWGRTRSQDEEAKICELLGGDPSFSFSLLSHSFCVSPFLGLSEGITVSKLRQTRVWRLKGGVVLRQTVEV